MAIHDQLPIHRTGVRLLALAVKVQEQLPRSVKRLLANAARDRGFCINASFTQVFRKTARHERSSMTTEPIMDVLDAVEGAR